MLTIVYGSVNTRVILSNESRNFDDYARRRERLLAKELARDRERQGLARVRFLDDSLDDDRRRASVDTRPAMLHSAQGCTI